MSKAWVFILEAAGKTRQGLTLALADLARIAKVVEVQVNRDYVPSCGGDNTTCRATATLTDILPAEQPYYFVDTLPDAPGASAYHVPGAAYCAISTCDDLYGPNGVSVDASHEVLEDAGNPGCNAAVDDGKGQLHERERCDAVETQTYTITLENDLVGVSVSNFLLDAWQTPGSRGPFTFMASKGIFGYVEPAGPFQTAKSVNGSGNYQIVFPSTSAEESQVFSKPLGKAFLKFSEQALPQHISNPYSLLRGKPKKPDKFFHWSSRAQRILARHNARADAMRKS